MSDATRQGTMYWITPVNPAAISQALVFGIEDGLRSSAYPVVLNNRYYRARRGVREAGRSANAWSLASAFFAFSLKR
jgi:hypothetical protein